MKVLREKVSSASHPSKLILLDGTQVKENVWYFKLDSGRLEKDYLGPAALMSSESAKCLVECVQCMAVTSENHIKSINR